MAGQATGEPGTRGAAAAPPHPWGVGDRVRFRRYPGAGNGARRRVYEVRAVDGADVWLRPTGGASGHQTARGSWLEQAPTEEVRDEQ